MMTWIAAMLLTATVQSPAALPEAAGFMKDLPTVVSATVLVAEMLDDKSIQFDSHVLGQYTYTETETTVTLDGKGNPRKTGTKVYQVVRGINGRQFYRKLVSRDGVPLSPAELLKQDREQDKREQKQREEELKRERREAGKAAAPAAGPSAEQQRDAFIRMLTEVYDVRLPRRGTVNGHTAVLLTLTPRPGVKPKDDFLDLLHHVEIRAWLMETDHEVLEVEAVLVEPLSFGFGLLGKASSGSLKFERMKIGETGGEFWTLSRVDARMTGSMFVLKSIREQSITEYSDFRKYSVDTVVGPAVAADAPLQQQVP